MKKSIEQDITLASQCYEHIQELIIDGTLPPGQKLKVEELKNQFSTGQSPIREALSRLAASGLVEAHNNKGFRVAQVSEADIRDLFQTMFQIDELALIQAMKHGDDAWEAGIVAALHQLALIETKKEPIAYNVWSARNYAFHVALIAGCGSPTLLQIRADLYRRFDRYCRISFNASQANLEPNHEEHKKLAEAVLKRDVKTVSALIHYHTLGALEDTIVTLKKSNIL
jgi:GntR family transcriptional regulator, carbon starvation induced regulator